MMKIGLSLQKFWKRWSVLVEHIFFPGGKIDHKTLEIKSKYLNQNVFLELFLPPSFKDKTIGHFPVLFFNDGQDLKAVRVLETLEYLYLEEKIAEIIVVGIYPNDRMEEYGTANRPDYKNRGVKAANYQLFIIQELMPLLEERYKASRHELDRAFAGFSLGGLSALDIVWNHPAFCATAGVFSGSLWWRSKAFDPSDPDANRIAHQMIEEGSYKPELRFWFQAGTKDEAEDRNHNGIIDAIDDTLQLIEILKSKGYQEPNQVKYVEIQDGIHHPQTWAEALPDFLIWCYGK